MPPKRRKLAEKAPKIQNSALLDPPRLPGSIPSLLGFLERGTYSQRNAAQARVFSNLHTNLLPMLQEREFIETTTDKIFACCWLDRSNVLFGTKDNKLLHLDVDAKGSKFTEIDRPPEPEHNFSTATPGWGQCGIHCMDLSPSGDLLATGGIDPADCVVLRTSDWSPVTTLVGHRDWVFGSVWVSDRHVVTASRDKAIALWSINPDENVGGPPTVQEYNYYNPKEMKRKYDGKIRELKYDKQLGLVAGLGTEGVVKLHDPIADLRVVRTLSIPHPRELVAMALRHDFVAVGSLNCITLSDPRKRDPGAFIAELTSPDIAQGVRSVCISGNMVSFGTGKGKIAFYDLRAAKFLPTTADPWDGPGTGILQPSTAVTTMPGAYRGAVTIPQVQALGMSPDEFEDGEGNLGAHPEAPTQYFQVGGGWLQENSTFWDYFGGQRVEHACYAHAWDPSGTRLIAAGGPLAFGLMGGYVALWE